MAEKNRKVLFGLIAVAIFVLVVFYLPRFFEQEIPTVCIANGECQHEAYVDSVISFMPAIIVLGFLLGVGASYFYFERKIELPVPQADRNKALLSMLHPSERKIMQKIIDNGGEALQSDLSRIEGVGKVRAHRVIDRLIRRGVLEKEEKGKTNVLRLKKDIKEAVSS
ncbi:TPA: hypothetical protein EYP38_02740 [Candidatus Micrarchaeota archaeon]|nr:hypothetical protein [Candidatus Micrarchaeota archaeon]